MAQAGLLGSKVGRRFSMRPHSIKKFFRTQMAVLRVQTDYIDYMTVHTISTYQDIRMRYIEFIRNAYHYFGLSINPKTRISKIDALKEIVKAHGLNPEEVLTKEALNMPNRTIFSNVEFEGNQVKILSRILHDTIGAKLKQ